MVKNLVTVLAPGGEKLNIELDPEGVWTLRKHTTPNWRDYVTFPNGKWHQINGLFGRELVLNDAMAERCFSLLGWAPADGPQIGKAQLVKKAAYGEWILSQQHSLPENLWIGLGYKGGGQYYLAGAETAFLLLFKLDNYADGVPVWVTTARLGPGLGYSGGPVLGIFSGFSTVQEMNGFHLEIYGDGNLALGLNVNKMFKSANMAQLAQYAKQVKEFGSLSPSQWEQLTWALKLGVAQGSGCLVDNTGPSANLYDIPVGGFGLEVSLFMSFSTLRVAPPPGWQARPDTKPVYSA